MTKGAGRVVTQAIAGGDEAAAKAAQLGTKWRSLTKASSDIAEYTQAAAGAAGRTVANAPLWAASRVVAIPTGLYKAPGAFRAASGLAGKAGVVMGAMQGVSQAAAVGLTGYHAAKGLGTMWNEGKLNGHEFREAIKSGIDAVTGGVGTTDMVLGAGRATANCVNSHGAFGCISAAGRSVAHGIGHVARATKSCFENNGVGGCVGSAASATKRGVVGFARAATVAAGNAAKGIYHGSVAVAAGARDRTVYCLEHPGRCARQSGKELRRGFTNMGRAVADPLKQCAYGRCIGSSMKHWQQRASDWRRGGLQNQRNEAQAHGDTRRVHSLERKIQALTRGGTAHRNSYQAPARPLSKRLEKLRN